MVYFKRIVNLALAFILLLWWQNGNVLADLNSRSLRNVYQESTSNYRETTIFEFGIHHHMLGKYYNQAHFTGVSITIILLEYAYKRLSTFDHLLFNCRTALGENYSQGAHQ